MKVDRKIKALLLGTMDDRNKNEIPNKKMNGVIIKAMAFIHKLSHKTLRSKNGRANCKDGTRHQ